MLAEGTTAPRATVSLSVILLGIVTVLVGGWGAAAPFAGPDFGFAADRYSAWQWSTTSLFLALIPGAVAFVCGLWVLAAATRPSYGRRPDLWLLGLIVAACGAWFVVGQYAWRALGNRAFIAPSGPTHFMWKELAFAVGPGVILVLCGALFMGWAVRRQLAVVAERYSRAVESPGVTPVAEPVAPVAPVGAAEPASTMAPPPVTTQQPVVERQVVPAAERPATAVGIPAAERPLPQQPVAEPVAAERPLAPTAERPLPQQPVAEPVAAEPVAAEPGAVTRPAHAAAEPGLVGRPVTDPTGRPPV